MNNTIEINKPTNFLKFLWNNNLPTGFINIFGIQKFENGTENIISKFIKTDQIELVDAAAMELNNQLNVYYGVGTRYNDLGVSRRG